MQNAELKLFVSCHKAAEYPHSAVVVPVQVNCANTPLRFSGMQPDNEGENISARNPSYCELTTQYWAWKNVQADYYGFCHYRRYFNFSGQEYPVDGWGNVVEDWLDDAAIQKYALADDEKMRAAVADYDVILAAEKDVQRMPGSPRNLYEQYKAAELLRIEDLDRLLAVLESDWPDYLPYAKRYLAGSKTCLCNMFIMKRPVFTAYCAWLFAVLEKWGQQTDLSDACAEALRTPGHLAERLLNIYCLYLKDHGNYRFGSLQTVIFEHTEPRQRLLPAFTENNVPVVFSANDFYVPYLAALLQSIKENGSKEHNYDLIVMNRDITPRNQQLLKAGVEQENISLRFYDVSRYYHRFDNMFLWGHFAAETYFRLLMPEILPDYNKVLYLDSDMIVQGDLAQLYATDVEGLLLAACRDPDTAGWYNGYAPSKKQYMDQVLKIEKPYDYFQAGAILFNLKEFRAAYTTQEMLRFAASYRWELLDQDVLNALAQGRVAFVDMAWNVMIDWSGIRIREIIARAPAWLRNQYMAARQAPKIIHYAGPEKPWQYPQEDFAERFWHYARKTPFYEIALARMSGQGAPAPKPQSKWKARLRGLAMPVVDLLLPKYSVRREKVKAFLRRLRGQK